MNLTIIIFKYILVVILDVLQTNMLKSEINFLSEMAWNYMAINQSLNQNTTLANCAFVRTRQVCKSPDLSKMRRDIIVRLLPQDSVAYAKLLCYRLEGWRQRHAATRRQVAA